MERPSPAQRLRHPAAGQRVGPDQPRDRERTMTFEIGRARELDALVKDVIDEAGALFPGKSLRDAMQRYQAGDLALALDNAFWAVKDLGQQVPASLYDKIVAANGKMNLFPVSYYDAVKPSGGGPG